MTDFAHLLGLPLLLLYLAHEWRAWRHHTAAPEVIAEPEVEMMKPETHDSESEYQFTHRTDPVHGAIPIAWAKGIE